MAKIKLKEYKATASKANKKAIKSNIDANPCHCGNLPIGLEEAHRRNVGKKEPPGIRAVHAGGNQMGELSKLPNIGKAVEAQLIQVGIETPEALREIGAKAAWLKIQEIDPSACIHRLLALEGAIEGVKKTGLPDAVKADLKAFYQEHQL